MAKRRIEFLNSCTGWDEGYMTTIEMEDSAFFYFNNVWGQWSIIEKDKESTEFVVYEPNKRKPRKAAIVRPETPEPPFICGGKDTTRNALLKRIAELRHE